MTLRRGLRLALVVMGLTAGAVLVATALIVRPDQQATPVEVGRDGPAPGFELPDLRDPARAVVLDDHADTPVVVNLWASWCVPCRREMPTIEAVHQAAGDQVRFLGVNHEDARGAALDLLDETGVTYPNGYDPRGVTARDYGLLGMPSTVFIAADGDVVATRTGEMTRGELEQSLSELFHVDVRDPASRDD